MMARLARFILLFSWSLAATTAFATTYYIDYSSGNDSSTGTSKATPWRHAPGMNGCSGSCSSASPQPGDSFILKGGVTWPNAALGWDWTWSGTSSSAKIGCAGAGCIYIGVDQTWYTGSSWSRPIINAGGSVVTATAAGSNVILRLYASYLKLDNIEFTGLYWTGVPAYGTGINLILAGGSPGKGNNVELSNLYIHGWSHNTNASGTSENPCGIAGDTGIPNNNANTWLHDSIISGADTAKDSCSAIFGAPPYISNNLLEYVSSCMITNGGVSIHDNICQNVVPSFDPNAHLNGLENNASQNILIYNNVFRHMGSGALTIWSAPDEGYTSYIFNNVVYDTDTGNVLDLAAPVANNGCAQGPSYCIKGGAEIVFNNTIECGQDSNPNAICVGGINTAVASVTLQNNHFITNAGSFWNTNGVTPTLISNVLQTKSTATSQGYTSGQTYAFAPTQPYPANATPGQGTANSILCTNSGGGACTDDTTYGVYYNASTHTVSSPGMTPALWSAKPDVGAYIYGGTQSVQAPTQLTATVQ